MFNLYKCEKKPKQICKTILIDALTKNPVGIIHQCNLFHKEMRLDSDSDRDDEVVEVKRAMVRSAC